MLFDYQHPLAPVNNCMMSQVKVQEYQIFSDPPVSFSQNFCNLVEKGTLKLYITVGNTILE